MMISLLGKTEWQLPVFATSGRVACRFVALSVSNTDDMSSRLASDQKLGQKRQNGRQLHVFVTGILPEGSHASSCLDWSGCRLLAMTMAMTMFSDSLVTMLVAVFVAFMFLVITHVNFANARTHMLQVHWQQGQGDHNAQDQFGNKALIADLILLADDVEGCVEAVLPTPSRHQRDACGCNRERLVGLGRAIGFRHRPHHVEEEETGECCSEGKNQLSEQRIASEVVLVEFPLSPKQESPSNQHDQDHLSDVNELAHRLVAADQCVQPRHRQRSHDAKDQGVEEHKPALPFLVVRMMSTLVAVAFFSTFITMAVSTPSAMTTESKLQEKEMLRIAACDKHPHALRG
mmetsp:Transcript_91479/g.191214  ORF Transcript_91479/g.191214 Transcript_91479/m.191214 type:complete len:346 (+) Transcript_91479:367-1404(+)